MGWVSMVRVFLFSVLFFALEHKSSGDVVTGIGPEVVEFEIVAFDDLIDRCLADVENGRVV